METGDKMNTLIAANWKMHGDQGWIAKPSVYRQLFAGKADVETLIFPPFYLLTEMVKVCNPLDISIGAQNCHFEDSGAFTGEMSAEMVADTGAGYVLTGHSERRTLFHETDTDVERKAVAALAAGLKPVICIGETQEERELGNAFKTVGAQFSGSVPETDEPARLVIAYEPVWAIGTGLTPTLEDIAAMHDFIRGLSGDCFGEKIASDIRILYGGSVKPANAEEILDLPDVNGALIGGASLQMDSFAAIANAV